MSETSQPLKGKITIVTGASRGIGKGIALALGDAGATVYVTGRTGAGQAATVPLSGTVEDTAEEVTKRGGIGIAVLCDHRDDAQTEALFNRVKDEHGRLDVLANSAWMGYEGFHHGNGIPFQAFWEQPLSWWDDNLFGPRAAYIASVCAVKLFMLEQKSGLIAHVSHRFDTLGAPAYNVAKRASDQMAMDMGAKLREHGVAAVSLYPGLVRTEGILKWQEYMDLSNSESPEYTGRAVAGLAADANVMDKSGRNLWVCDLAKEYSFTDTDGTVPVPTWYGADATASA